MQRMRHTRFVKAVEGLPWTSSISAVIMMAARLMQLWTGMQWSEGENVNTTEEKSKLPDAEMTAAAGDCCCTC
jgi:hypothetical protein